MNRSVKCSKCQCETESLLVSFKFFPNRYDYVLADYYGPMPCGRHTIQNDKIVCNRCCGFSLDKPRPQYKMQGHYYTWTDGTKTFFAQETKTLCESVLEDARFLGFVVVNV